jgi:hypothetical protein
MSERPEWVVRWQQADDDELDYQPRHGGRPETRHPPSYDEWIRLTVDYFRHELDAREEGSLDRH